LNHQMCWLPSGNDEHLGRLLYGGVLSSGKRRAVRCAAQDLSLQSGPLPFQVSRTASCTFLLTTYGKYKTSLSDINQLITNAITVNNVIIQNLVDLKVSIPGLASSPVLFWVWTSFIQVVNAVPSLI